MKRYQEGGLIVAVTLLAVVGCSESDSETKDAGGDKGVVEDTTPGDTSKSDAADPDAVKPDGSDDDASAALQLACGAHQFCRSCCSSGDATCKDACDDAMSDASKTAWDGVESCAATNCADCTTDEECTTCMDQKCSDERAACNYGPEGSSSCDDTLTCLGDCPQMTVDASGTPESCPTDPGIVCFQGCMQAATTTAGKQAYELGYCMYSQCSPICFTSGKDAECDTCLADKCTDLKAACDNN